MSNLYQKSYFLIFLLIIAISSLIWLFKDFIAVLFFAILLAITCFPIYKKFTLKLPKTLASLIITTLILVIVIFPISYVLLEVIVRTPSLLDNFKTEINIEVLSKFINDIANSLTLSDEIRELLQKQINDNLQSFINTIKSTSIGLLQEFLKISLNFLFFIFIIIFSLFYLFTDGLYVVNKIKTISPLSKKYNNVFINEFKGLAVALILNFFVIALLQGILFAIGAKIVGLPWLFLGLAIAIASFLPIIGGILIWGPVSIYLYIKGQNFDSIFIALWGAIIVGGVMDYLARPLLLKKISIIVSSKKNPLSYTFINALSTLAGILQFGIMGLFLGPAIASVAITIFNVYEMNVEDKKNTRKQLN